MIKKHIFSIFASALLLFPGNAAAYSVHLPASLQTIEEESFKGNIHLEKLVLHDNIVRIESEAFADTGLHSIYCEDISAISIAADAFDSKNFFLFPTENTELCVTCGTEGQVNFKRYPALNGADYTYSSANPYAVEVDENGCLRALRSGKTEITVTGSDGGSANFTVVTERWANTHNCISMAHRGASGYYPDNSLAAFIGAHALGAEMIELDVRKTEDNQLVCHHDSKITIRGRTYKISERTLAQLQRADKNICSLAQALSCIQALGDMKLLIELKDTGIEQDVLMLANASGMKERICFGSFSWGSVSTIEMLDPSAETIFITNSAAHVQSIYNHASSFNTDGYSISKSYLSEGLVSKIHLAGKKIYGWTIDEPNEISYYKSLGLDGITSNYPDRV